jgi:hypothetical protein
MSPNHYVLHPYDSGSYYTSFSLIVLVYPSIAMQDENQSTTRPKRNQSEIARKWWDAKRVKMEEHLGIQDQRDSLLEEVAMLSEQKAVLMEDLKAAREELNELKQNDLVAALIPFGGLSKIVDKATRVAVIGRGIMALLSVVMSRTHATTRLRTVCDAIFEHAIFGLEATEVVLNEMYQKNFFKRNREVFSVESFESDGFICCWWVKL